MEYFYIGDEYKNLVDKIFKYAWMDRNLHLTIPDNENLA